MKNILLLLFLTPIFYTSGYSQQTNQSDTIKADKVFGGPSSVQEQIKRDESHEAIIFQSYFDFKSKLKKSSGFSYVIDYFSDYQIATASRGKKSAFSGVFRVFGSWDLIGKKSDNTGSLVFKVENRHSYGKFIVPQSLASEIGYAGLTSITFNDMGWGITNFYWQQHFFKNRLSFMIGIVEVTDYLNIYGLANPWNDASNLTFSTGATIPIPLQGLGATVRAMITENIYILAGLEDANGNPSKPLQSFESFFGEAEYFSHVEVGWIGSYKNRFSDNMHLTYWHADARKEAGIPEGWGLNLSLCHMIDDRWEPFLRGGYANKSRTFLSESLDVGVGYHFPDNNNQLALALSWGNPSKSTFGQELKDQYTMELYYRLHLMKIITIMPDIQLLINPALNPDTDFIAVFGLRGRINI